jgi:hypothetical protein
MYCFMKKIFIFTLAGLSLLLGSCKKDWLTLKPKDKPISKPC